MSDTKPGPASPEKEGADAPTPPGGPQRQDDAAGAGGPLDSDDTGAGEQASDSVEERHEGTIPIEDEQPDPDATSEETATQRENAESSTEQPSQ